MTRTAFIPALSGFRSSIEPLLPGFGPRAVRFLFAETISEVLDQLKLGYFGGVEAYNLGHHLERWLHRADLLSCAAQAAKIYAALDYFHAHLIPPARLDRLPAQRRRSFQGYFWERGLDSLRANAAGLLEALAVTVLLPDEWYPKATLDRQIKDELNRLGIFREISITPDLGLEPGGLSWIARTTRRAVVALRETLASGRPWPLRMIGDPDQLSGNRQVIAYDIKDLPGEGVRFEAYEPDCLCLEHAVLVDLSGEKPVVVEHCPPGPPTPLAGLICERYERATPPIACLNWVQRSPRLREWSWRLRRLLFSRRPRLAGTMS